MKLLTFTTLLAAPSALAQPTPRADGSAFGIMTLRSASPIHFGRVTASEGGLFVNGHIPDATCDGEVPRQSYFSLENGQLYLYGGDKFPRQLVYVDRSPAGQGKIGFVSDGQKPPGNTEVKGWKTTPSGQFESLAFADTGLLACPTDGPEWTMWVTTDVNNPGGNEGCLGFTGTVQSNANAVPCKY